MYRSGALALLLAIGLAAPAAAQRIQSPYTFVDETQGVGAFAGWVFGDGGALELGLIDAPIVGLRYGIRLSGPFTIEADLGYIPGQRAVVDTTLTADSTFALLPDTAGLDLVLLTGALRFDLTGPRTYRGLMPYVTALGGAVLEMGGDEDADRAVPVSARFDFGTSFAGGVGGGLEWFPTRHITARADARALFWKLSTPEGLLGRNLATPDEEWVRNIGLTAGVTLRF